jgi:two-component system, OmpR family, alkaline phosphatase synthesis response regulator PhoP
MRRILVVEDSPELAFGLRNNLEIEGYEVSVAADGTAALAQASEFKPDLILLDLGIPEPDGFRVLRTLRDRGDDVPVMILSAAGEETSKVRGLRIGADDFVTKPFSILELLARVEALLRRPRPAKSQSGAADVANIERFGEVEVDLDSRAVTVRGKFANLTPRAFDLLAALVRRRGTTVTRNELMREVWGHRAVIASRTVDTHIADIRREIEDDPNNPRYLVTVWKTGYRLQD